IAPPEIWATFVREYLANRPHSLGEYRTSVDAAGRVRLDATLRGPGSERRLSGAGNGPIDAFVDALSRESGTPLAVAGYHEHALGAGADAVAIAYVELEIDGERHFGVGRDVNIVTASLDAILSALHRAGAPEENYAAIAVR
ncbi:MAG TPA: alpha-isopropylmalate synthase regulatory domain-containing protein, partial [Candidatus Baltobacteraceae bacterium]|nr:alpha-isopropylmalate synthase regulatory domain-containing protein [Candidatus Baltobacteraceae bacterium]